MKKGTKKDAVEIRRNCRCLVDHVRVCPADYEDVEDPFGQGCAGNRIRTISEPKSKSSARPLKATGRLM